MRLRSTAALLVALVFASVNSALAQVTTTGSIQVIVEDSQGGRLPGVTVSTSAVDVVTSRQAVSDAEGVAKLDALAPSANYIVKASLSGFRDLSRTAILVRSGQVTTLPLQLTLTTMTESVTVTGQTSPLVDVTRAVSGTDITLRLTESLPTGRSYQSYLQLVPGVMPDSTISGGNPASRSGVNFKENSATADNIGASTDNVYYFEGINVTDPVTGTFGANLNTEIIQEQKVITGGIPAEFVGASGLISTVITKSGSNAYSGSGNYFFRNDSFIAENVHNPGATFSTKDTAFTVGGPVVSNKVWAFGSYRYVNTGQDVNASDTRVFLRRAETISKQGFVKGTYAPTQNDMVTFTFLNDPQTRNADTDGSVANSRVRRREQGGNRYSVGYNRVWNNFLLDIASSYHDAALSDFAADTTKSRNTVAFQSTAVRSLAEEQLGGFGQNFPETRPTYQSRGSLQYQWNGHTFKGGLEWTQHEDHRNLQYTGPDAAQYTSISNVYLPGGGISAGLISGTAVAWSTRQFRTATASDFNGLIAKINTLPNRAQFYQLYDTNADGTITAAEMNASLVFNQTAGNPDGQINYYRTIQTAEGPQDQKVVGVSFFAQDEFNMNRLTFNVGVRGERWGHYATTGDKVFQFPMVYAPRVSAVYDLRGDGKQKASAYWGRYYDPVRMDMTNFAGTATGQQRDEQVFINNQWVTYRTRGGATTIDGFFSPTTKTPYTDELQLQYEVDLGHNMSASATYYNRKTRNIFEDFDPGLYTEPSVYPGDVNAPGGLFLGWEYFGWTAANHPAANFFLGTLPDGERNYNGLELVFRKRYSDRWQALASYSYLDAKGNAISDGNADFAGDVLWLDPRAPNMYGTVAGTIKNLFKTGGSYTTPFGLEIGANFRWNSGSIVNRTQFASSRRLPVEVAVPYVFNGVTDAWVAEGAIGAVQNPGWGQFDTRVQYVRRMGHLTGEVFLDIFNITNSQAAIRLQDLEAGSGTTKFLDEFVWNNPRNAFLGFRVRF